MSALKRAAIGILQAIGGASIFVLLFFLFVLPVVDFVLTGSPLPHYKWNRSSMLELLQLALAGVVYLSWWIVPVGAFFGSYLSPRIRQWNRAGSFLKGARLGAALGLITAVLFAITAQQTPTMVVRSAIVFLPVYCGVWCGMYARRVAKT